MADELPSPAFLSKRSEAKIVDAVLDIWISPNCDARISRTANQLGLRDLLNQRFGPLSAKLDQYLPTVTEEKRDTMDKNSLEGLGSLVREVLYYLDIKTLAIVEQVSQTMKQHVKVVFCGRTKLNNIQLQPGKVIDLISKLVSKCPNLTTINLDTCVDFRAFATDAKCPMKPEQLGVQFAQKMPQIVHFQAGLATEYYTKFMIAYGKALNGRSKVSELILGHNRFVAELAECIVRYFPKVEKFCATANDPNSLRRAINFAKQFAVKELSIKYDNPTQFDVNLIQGLINEFAILRRTEKFEVIYLNTLNKLNPFEERYLYHPPLLRVRQIRQLVALRLMVDIDGKSKPMKYRWVFDPHNLYNSIIICPNFFQGHLY